ncbi:hypothetical protein [Entomomonas asaccharolytica]|uniref:Uncharacterized protein n=1 Tax=Entomomonas asaccharolytica TaxID=2785331 RepID=A0A974RXC9_9GAMM|nr:hypothetical protein [Entomomonas asaccharolytica]QQP86047.1 hypothetical protein JHT90_01980 [Entomomonas asaccharolytica]
MVITVFDAEVVVADLKQQQGIRRKRRVSKLIRYESALLALYANGASVADLQRWLQQRHIKVAPSTISRWLAKQHG